MRTTKTQYKRIYGTKRWLLTLLATVLLMPGLNLRAQVTIGMETPSVKGALLQLKEKDNTDGDANATRGLILPRVKLTSLTITSGDDLATTIENAVEGSAMEWDKEKHTGLSVYNLTDNTASGGNICPGVYAWNGSKWIRLHEPCNSSLIFAPNYNVDPGSTTLYVNTEGSFTQGTGDDCTRGAGVAHSEMPAGVFKYTGAEGEAFAGYTYDHASGITVTIDAATLATGAGELPVKVSGTVDAAYAGKAFDIPVTILGQQLYVRVSVGCGAYTTAMADRTIVKSTPQLTGDPDWLQFQCFNLGADTSLDPFTYVSNGDKVNNDIKGFLYQWGRRTDGHQDRNSGSDGPIATSPTNAGNQFIKTNGDWLAGGGEPTRWGDGTQESKMERGYNDPCPTGWKVPSQKQWQSIFAFASGAPATATQNTWTWSNGYKVGDALYLPVTGFRISNGGNLSYTDWGAYWSSTLAPLSAGDANAYNLWLKSDKVTPDDTPVFSARAVRCVIDEKVPCNDAAIESAVVESCIPYMFTYQTMRLTATGYDDESNVVTVASYQWSVNGTEVPGATSEIFNYTPASDIVLTDDGLGNMCSNVTISCKMSNSLGVKIGSYPITVVQASATGLSPIHVKSLKGDGTGETTQTFAHVNLGAEGDTDPCNMQGDLYQWGRMDDGHQLRNSESYPANDNTRGNGIVTDPAAFDPATGQILSTYTDAEGKKLFGKFIKQADIPYNWRSDDNMLWGDGTTEYNQDKGKGDPCPDGWKIPSQQQWNYIFRKETTSTDPGNATVNTWTKLGTFGANNVGGYQVESALYLPAAGYRQGRDASLIKPSTFGVYWNTMIELELGVYYGNGFTFSGSSIMPSERLNRSHARSIRCIKDNTVPCTPPAITTHPSTSAVPYCNGTTAANVTALSVAATGSGTLTYQWYSNTTASKTGGTLITGATTNSYKPSTTANGDLYYYCVVTGTCGNATSDVSGKVTVTAATAITTHPSTAAASYCQNTAVASVTALSVSATGTGTLTYQWYSNTTASKTGGTLITGATTNSYEPSTSSSGDLYYYCVVTGTCGTATSNVSGKVTVNALPAAPVLTGTSQVCSGTSITKAILDGFITPVSGVVYKYYTTSAGTTEATLPVTASGTTSRTFHARAVNSSTGCVSAGSTTLTVTINPLITSVSITGGGIYGTGGTITLTANVAPAGATIKKYEWYKNGSATPVYTSTSSNKYVITGATVAHAGSYVVKVKDACDIETASSAAEVSVISLIRDYNVEDPSSDFVDVGAAFVKGTGDAYTRGTGVAHSSMAAGYFRYQNNGKSITFGGFSTTVDGVTITIPAKTIAANSTDAFTVSVSGTPLSDKAGKAYDIPITVFGKQLYVRVQVGCGAYTTPMADRTIVKGSPQLVTKASDTGDPDWLQFQCYNLGTNATTLDPFIYSTSILGGLYQWGRNTDGHEIRTSATTETLATSNTPGHSYFILQSNTAPNDWRSGGGEIFRWSDGKERGENDPCPLEWRVPSSARWASIFNGMTSPGQDSEIATAYRWTWTGNGYKIGGSLYLPAGSLRGLNGGALVEAGVGKYGDYWSSTVSGTNSYGLRFYNNPNNYDIYTAYKDYRVTGQAVRCVKDK